MSRDPAREARRWVRQAEADLADARALAELGSAATACFLAQQATEKALKGVLYADGADTVLGHSVQVLCREVAERHREVAARCRDWATLDLLYIPTRYPDALPDGVPSEVFTRAQADAAIALAAEAIDFASGRVPG